MKKSIFLFFAAILCAIGASAATKTIYFKSQQWWHKDNAASAAYYWGTDGEAKAWPGTRMTKVAGETNVWSIDIDTDKYPNVIFIRVNGSGAEQDWGAKTEDLVIPTDSKNFFTLSNTEAWDGNKATGSWSVYTPTVTHTFAKNSTLYIDFRAITDASKKGANYPKAGTASELDYSANAGGTVIPVTFTADVKWAEGAEFMKTDKGGWASIPFKAPEAGQNCAQVAADGKSYTWTTFSEPSVTLSLDKTEADAGTEVTVTLTATADNVSGEVTYAFQYSTDNATWNNITATGNTATQTFAAETRYYKVTMTNGGTTKEATAKFSAIKFHVIGSWDSWTAHNEVVEGSKTITLEANTTYEYKITNGTWDLSWGNDGTMKRENCTNWSFEASGNAKITTDEAGDYVFNVSRNAEGKVVVSVTYPELVTPIPTYDYYIAGNMNDWNPKHPTYGMTDEDADGIYEKEITLAAGQDHQFKVTNGKWGNEEGGFDCATVEGAYEEVDSKDGNVLVKLNAETTFIVKFDKNAKKITFKNLTEKVIEYGVTFNVTVPEGTEACYICGEWDWTTFKPMTYIDDTHYTLTIDNATKDHKYKYTFGEAWAYVEKKADGSDVQDRTWNENDVVAAWANPLATNIYLAGSMTDWANGKIEFMKETPDATIATVAVELPVGDNTFKIIKGETWLGNGGIIDNSITGWTFKDGDSDCTLKATYAATYVFTWDLTKEDQQLSVTYPTVETLNYPSLPKTLVKTWRTAYTELDLGNYNTITIFNHDGTDFTYGDDFEVIASLDEVNLEGTGSWKVDGDDEVLDATLYNEEKTAIYLITASTAAPKTYTLNCTDAQYASTAYGTVFTGTADGKVLMIDVSMMQVGVNEAFGICSWNDIEITSILATVTKAGDKYSLTGDFTDAAGNTYKVTITDATPKPATELTVTGATFTESAWGSVDITGVWGSEELGATLGSAEFGDQDWGVEIWTESIYLTPIGSVNFAQADDGVSVVLKGQFSDANANPYNVSITGTLVEYVTPVVEFGDGDNTTAMSDYEWQTVDAKIKRTFVAEDGWYTLCVPFGMDASLIGEAYEITSINKNDKTQGIDVTFSEVDYLLAGNPYLIKPTATVTDPVIEGVGIEYTTGEEYTVTGDNIKITMTGIINGGGTTNGTTEYYVGADGYLYNGEVDKLGLRALFTITDLAGNATRVRARVVTGENATTGVDDTFTTDVPVKAIENGQLIIIRDGVKYNVQGQKL